MVLIIQVVIDQILLGINQIQQITIVLGIMVVELVQIVLGNNNINKIILLGIQIKFKKKNQMNKEVINHNQNGIKTQKRNQKNQKVKKKKSFLLFLLL